jgi:membrane protein involved in colicin uptake
MSRLARNDEEALAYCVSAMLHVVLIAALCVGAVLGLKWLFANFVANWRG